MFRWMVGLTMLLIGAWMLVLLGASTHTNYAADFTKPENWLFWALTSGFCIGGALVLGRGWPIRRKR